VSRCARYYQIYFELEAAGQGLKNPNNSAAFRDTLAKLRAHSEVCADCQADFMASWGLDSMVIEEPKIVVTTPEKRRRQ
jgi:hypothetical protein